MSWRAAPVTSGFMEEFWLDSGGYNKGIDLGTPEGTPIDATVGGTVLSAGDSGDGWGISVKVRDANGLTHNYGHLNEVHVSPGDTIGPGQVLGLSGNTGKSTGPHLSYDIWDESGTYVDPSPYIYGSPGNAGEGGAAMATPNFRGMADQLRGVLDLAIAGYPELDADEQPLAMKEITSLAELLSGLEMAAEGPEGLTPAALFQLESSYVATLNTLGLQKYNLSLDREQLENDRLTKEFTGKLATYGATLDFDEATRRKAETEIQRWLNIQQEARTRAQSEAQTALDAAPFQTSGGKVAFTASDLGGGVGALAGMANMDPNAELLRYPGLTTVDQPGATDRYIEGMGGAGAAPTVPGMITTPGMIPQAPNLNPYNTPLPDFIAPPNPSSLAAAYNAAAQAQQAPPPRTPSLAVQSRGNDPGVQLPPTFKDNSFVPPGSVPVDAVQLGPDFVDRSYAPNGAPLIPTGGGNIRATGNLLPVPTLEGVQNAGGAIVSGAKDLVSLIAPYWRR